MNLSKREREREKEKKKSEKKKVKKRNYLIELNTWKKGTFVYNSQLNITLNCINQWSICC
jgi:hypothetical protein